MLNSGNANWDMHPLAGNLCGKVVGQSINDKEILKGVFRISAFLT